MIGGFRSDLSITCMIDGNFGNVSAGVLFRKSRINENGGNTHLPIKIFSPYFVDLLVLMGVAYVYNSLDFFG